MGGGGAAASSTPPAAGIGTGALCGTPPSRDVGAAETISMLVATSASFPGPGTLPTIAEQSDRGNVSTVNISFLETDSRLT